MSSQKVLVSGLYKIEENNYNKETKHTNVNCYYYYYYCTVITGHITASAWTEDFGQIGAPLTKKTSTAITFNGLQIR